MWVYGSGFPKSHNIGKAINKIDGVKFDSKPAEGVGFMKPDSDDWHQTKNMLTQTGESSERAKVWEGWGTALKPAHEPIVVARKPIEAGLTIAENCLKWGTGLNIDGCRVKGSKGDGVWGTSNKTTNPDRKFNASPNMMEYRSEEHRLGRWPANFIIGCDCDTTDGHSAECPCAMLDKQSGTSKSTGGRVGNAGSALNMMGRRFEKGDPGFGDKGGASRFFYCAKASKAERDAGPNKNNHPTVKPVALMRYLVRLVTPTGGVVLDPFLGSGTTGVGAKAEGFDFIGIEKEEEYLKIADARISHQRRGAKLTDFEEAE